MKLKKLTNYYIKLAKNYIWGTNDGRMLYAHYAFRKGEKCFYIFLYLGLIAFIAYIFYRSILATILLAPLTILFISKQSKKLSIRQKKTLNEQFRETILAVSANLKAGYSMENAFCEAYQDIVMLYGRDSMMAKELLKLQGGLQNNMILEDLLLDFASRSDLDDVKDFAEIFCIAKRNGGDINAIIRNTSLTIGEKIEVRRDIDTMISARAFEQKIMNLIPFGIILYISSTSPGFFKALYHNVKGNLIMTICLLIYGAAFILSERIIKIEV